MFLTFNDLSAKNNNINTEIDAKALFEEFVLFCKHLVSISAIDEVIFPDVLFSLSLYNNKYGITQWLTDNNVPKSQRQFFSRFLDKYCRYYNNQNVDGEFSVSIDGQEHTSIGCVFALEHSHILLSLPTNVFWKNESITGKYSSLDDTGEIRIFTKCIDNVWTSMAWEKLDLIYKKKLSEDIASGQDLWEKREKLYPNLVFCENIKDQLFADSEKYHIMAVMEKLDRFQEYFSSCGNLYNPKELGMSARTESETVKTNTELKKLRKFKLPNGNIEYFFDHVGFTGKYTGGRIYFLPDNSNKICYIGYIGKHLPTKNY